MMKSVHKYKKVTKPIFFCYCNTVKWSAELTAKEAFRRTTKNTNKNINVMKQIYMSHISLYPTSDPDLQHSRAHLRPLLCSLNYVICARGLQKCDFEFL